MRHGPGAIRRSSSRLLLGCVFGVVLLLCADVCLGQPDEQSDGQTTVVHDVFLDGQEHYPDYVFYAYPRDFLRSNALPGNICVPFQAGRPIDINRFNPSAVSRNGGVQVVAVPLSLVLSNGGSPEVSWFDGTTAGVFTSAEKLVGHSRVATLPGDPIRFVTRYNVTLDRGVALSLTVDGPAPRSVQRIRAMPRLSPSTLIRSPVRRSWFWRLVRRINPRNAVFAVGSVGVILALMVVNRRGRTASGDPSSTTPRRGEAEVQAESHRTAR